MLRVCDYGVREQACMGMSLLPKEIVSFQTKSACGPPSALARANTRPNVPTDLGLLPQRRLPQSGGDTRDHRAWSVGGYPPALSQCLAVLSSTHCRQRHQKEPIAPCPWNLPLPSAPCE